MKGQDADSNKQAYNPARRPLLLTGAGGQLGRALQCSLTRLGPIVALERGALDLADNDAIRARIRAENPIAVVNAGAYTAVDRAERDTDLAMRINGEAPGILAEAAAQIGACFVHYSSDYVFPGNAGRPYRESDATAPINAYGRSKLAGEQAVLAANPAALIFRTCWVYSAVGNNFLLTMQRAARERATLSVVDDQIGNPTSTAFLAGATTDILAALSLDASTLGERAGIYHLSSEGQASWWEFAKAIISPQFPQVEVNAIGSDHYPTPAERPAYSVLDKSKVRSTFGLNIPDWTQMLAAVLASQVIVA